MNHDEDKSDMDKKGKESQQRKLSEADEAAKSGTTAISKLGDEEFVKEVRKKHYLARTASRTWRESALKCFDYVGSKQAPSESDFYIVLNLIVHRFLTQVGILTVGKPNATVYARNMEERYDSGAVMKDLVEYCAEQGDMTPKTSMVVNDRIICGLGVIRESFDLNKTRYTTKLGEVPGDMDVTKEDPLAYCLPPDNTAEEMTNNKGPKWYTKVKKRSREETIMMYPEMAHKIAMLGADDPTDKLIDKGEVSKRDLGTYGADDRRGDADTTVPAQEDELIILEYWYRKKTPKNVVIQLDKDPKTGRTHMDLAYLPEWNRDLMNKEYPYKEYGEPGEPIDPANMPEPTEIWGDMLGENIEYKIRGRIEEEVWYAEICGDVLLIHEPSPYVHNLYPDLFLCGEFRQGEPMPYGTVERLITPQDIVNAGLTLIQDNASRSSNPGKVILPHLVARHQRDRIDEILEEASWILVGSEEAQRAEDVIKEYPAAPLPQQYLDLLTMIMSMFDEISSMAQVQRGGMPYETSGKGLQTLLQAGDTALTYLKEGVEKMITNWGRMRIRNIQQYFFYEDALRVSDDLQTYHMAWDLYTDPETMETTLAMYKKDEQMKDPKMLFADFATVQFDVVVGVKSKYADRNREEKMEILFKLHDRGAIDTKYLVFHSEDIENPKALWDRLQELEQMQAELDHYRQMFDVKNPMGQLLKVLQNPGVAVKTADWLQKDQGVDIQKVAEMMENDEAEAA